ncbi:MAG: hypothetical protein Q9179_001126 [Wetmoreana sp. 5 TL-2023]
MDRRGQATFVRSPEVHNTHRSERPAAAKNPNANLTSQFEAPIFKFRLTDRNNATNMHFFSLITGERWKAEPLRARRRWKGAQGSGAARSGFQGAIKQAAALGERAVSHGGQHANAGGVEEAKKQLKEAKERKAA